MLSIVILTIDLYYIIMMTLICVDTSTVLSLIFDVIICVLFTHSLRLLLNIPVDFGDSALALSLAAGLSIFYLFADPRQVQSISSRIRSVTSKDAWTRVVVSRHGVMLVTYCL